MESASGLHLTAFQGSGKLLRRLLLVLSLNNKTNNAIGEFFIDSINYF